ncbi:hypothetical protein WJX73_002281 [Symbiochloris irregularis]|uniref:Uncharacterized protein n=1 Tax=Symbiochloris irregularis TaxID=706552 RepID=A0AAW1PY58_9CHLO
MVQQSRSRLKVKHWTLISTVAANPSSGHSKEQLFLTASPGITRDISASLESLELGATLYTQDLAAFGQLERLRHLDLTLLNHCVIDEASLCALGGLTALHTLLIKLSLPALPGQLLYSSLAFLKISPVQHLGLPATPQILTDSPELPMLMHLESGSIRVSWPYKFLSMRTR